MSATALAFPPQVLALNINPLLLRTEPPPIPEAKAWTVPYDGTLGPLIDFSQAVPGYPPHPELLAKLGEAAAGREATAYGDIAGDPALRERYAEHVSELYGARIGGDNVAITAGCNQAFFVAMLALAKAGDAVLLPTPWYFNHKMTLDMLGVEAIPLPCRADAGFLPDPEEARALMNPRIRAVVLVTPNNPTGAIYPAELIGRFHALCAERGAALLLDETYRDFIAPAPGPPHGLFKDPQWERTLVQLYSFSKSYCIPGHRVGALVAGTGLVAEIEKVLDCLQICAPRTAQLVLPWALPALAEWRAENCREILRRAEAFKAAVPPGGRWMVASIGAYFAYVQHPYPDRTAGEVAEWLARHRGVLSLPGPYFGPGQEQHLRVAFANVDVEGIAAVPGRLAAD